MRRVEWISNAEEKRRMINLDVVVLDQTHSLMYHSVGQEETLGGTKKKGKTLTKLLNSIINDPFLE